jgi:uncharacterized BrkB/YihY/UPF0761 family membrane protein
MDVKGAQSFDTKIESGGALTTVAIASLLATVWVAVFSMIMALIVGRNNKTTDKLILFWLVLGYLYSFRTGLFLFLFYLVSPNVARNKYQLPSRFNTQFSDFVCM